MDTINDTKKEEAEGPKEEKTEKKNEISKSGKTKREKGKGKEKDIYFIITYTLNKKEELNNLIITDECESSPNITIILNKETKTDNNKYTYIKVFKYKNIGAKKSNKLIFLFGEELHKYIISFENKDKTFIYDVEHKKSHKFLIDCFPEIIQQNITYQDKLDIFLEALKKNKEENKIQELYKEAIEFYSKKGKFSFLISLFSKIYEEKNICESLLEKFYYMNYELKQKGKKELSINADRDDNLREKFNSIMTKIESESEQIIENNRYNPIHFYGVILSYFNYYDYNIFKNCFNKLYKDNPIYLYEILLIYYSQFFKPIKMDQSDKEFFNNFFDYIIYKKNFSYFTLGLKFVVNLDIFIYIIDQTKEKIYEKYIDNNNNESDFVSIELDDKLIFKKEMIKEIYKGIKSINEYSRYCKTLLVYFTSNFWKSLLKEFDKSEPECFQACNELSRIFIEYSDIIKSICNKEKDNYIFKDIEDFLQKDEFAYQLNEKIKIFFKNNKGLSNLEIIGFTLEYNPYYQVRKYKSKREQYILDYLDFRYDIYNND